MDSVRALRAVTSPKDAPSLAALFHRLNRVLPANQVLEVVRGTTPVSVALETMKRCGYSQLPVVEGNAVLGLFSYRSFAHGVSSLRKVKGAICDMPVEEFIEPPNFARVTDEFRAIFDSLDRDGVVLVGEPDRLQGVVTAVDLLRYLYGVASPFVLIAEIEIAIRALIERAVDATTLAGCAKLALAAKYNGLPVPAVLTDMDFSDYVALIGYGGNWNYFEPVFGGMRETVRAKLDDIRSMRNDVFHFKRDLTWEDNEKLSQYRNWALMRARKSDAAKFGDRT